MFLEHRLPFQIFRQGFHSLGSLDGIFNIQDVKASGLQLKQ